MSKFGSDCRHCGARILWRKNTYNKRWVPLDAHPTANGNWTVDDYTETCLELGPHGRIAERGLLYTRHDCPEGRKALGKA